MTVERLKPGPKDITGRVPAPDDSPPKHLGDYRILREVGRGGMGIVYEAEQESLGRHVAVKVLRPGFISGSKQLSRFEREARAAGRLHHTNIVPVFGVGQEGDTHYYVMQLIQGQPLDEVVAELKWLRQGNRLSGTEPPDRRQPTDAEFGHASKSSEVGRQMLSGQFPRRRAVATADTTPGAESGARGEPKLEPIQAGAAGGGGSSGSSSTAVLPGSTEVSSATHPDRNYWQSVARIGVQLADALDYAHHQGVLHRDIKPSNILLDAHGTAWVTDFGLAKVTEQEGLTETGDLLGTLRYMAPEALRGKADGRTDLRGLGLTLYELIALRPAFDDTDRSRLIQRISEGEITRLRRINPEVPRDLETIVMKSVDRDPADRYQTAGELAADLQRFLSHEPIHARRTSLSERFARWCRRNPLVSTLTGSVAILLVVIAVGATVAAVRLRDQRDAVQANLGRAVKAEGEARQTESEARQAARLATERLFESYRNQARAGRWSGRPGQRFESLEALAGAARILPALALGDETAVKLRNEAIACMTLADLRLTRQWKPKGSARSVHTFDVDFRRYACRETKQEDTIFIHRTTDDREILRLPGFGIPPTIVRFSPDGRFLAVKYHGGAQIHFCVWDLKRRQAILRVPDGVQHGAFGLSPDSQFIAAGQADGSIRIYELPTGAPREPLRPGRSPISLQFHPKGGQLAVSSLAGTVEIREVDGGRLIRTFKHPLDVRGIAWSLDGELLAAACADFRVYVWEADNPRRPRAVLEGHRAEVIDVAFNRTGDLLASTAWDGTTRLWDPVLGRQLLSANGYFMQFSRDGRQMAIADGKTVGLWEVAAGRSAARCTRPWPPRDRCTLRSARTDG